WALPSLMLNSAQLSSTQLNSAQLRSATATTTDQADARDGRDATDAGHGLGARGLGEREATGGGYVRPGRVSDRQRGHRTGE
ncbi:MAG: hypothetical protein O3A19_08615, partial [Planctomycetota bacterium]|nr:hypothetical protein [Planctomycetota bacterium]